MSSIGGGGGKLDVSEMLRQFEAQQNNEVSLEDVVKTAEKVRAKGDDPAEMDTKTGNGVPANAQPEPNPTDLQDPQATEGIDPTKTTEPNKDCAEVADTQQDRGESGQKFLDQKDDTLKNAVQSLNINRANAQEDKDCAEKISAQDLLAQMQIQQGVIKS